MKYFIFDQFLSSAQCDLLVEMSKTRLSRALEWDVSRGESVTGTYRTSEHTFYQKSENMLVKFIEDKIAMYTKIPVTNCEGLSVIYYREGAYYKAHYDYFDPAYLGNKAVLERGGQRIMTVIIYLNDVLDGGATYFPTVDLTISPIKCRAIFWMNVLDDMTTVDPTTYHEGLPPLNGSEKWICTLWIRSGVFV